MPEEEPTFQILSLSNSSLDKYPSNSLSKFTHYLPRSLNARSKIFAIALTNIVVQRRLTSKKQIGYIKVHLDQLESQPCPQGHEDKCLARIPFSPASEGERYPEPH